MWIFTYFLKYVCDCVKCMCMCSDSFCLHTFLKLCFHLQCFARCKNESQCVHFNLMRNRSFVNSKFIPDYAAVRSVIYALNFSPCCLELNLFLHRCHDRMSL